MSKRRCEYDLGSCLVRLGKFGACAGSEEAHADTFVYRHQYTGACGKPIVAGKYAPECEDGHPAEGRGGA